MDEKTRKALEEAGWRIDGMQDLLGLTKEDVDAIEAKLKIFDELNYDIAQILDELNDEKESKATQEDGRQKEEPPESEETQ